MLTESFPESVQVANRLLTEPDRRTLLVQLVDFRLQLRDLLLHLADLRIQGIGTGTIVALGGGNLGPLLLLGAYVGQGFLQVGGVGIDLGELLLRQDFCSYNYL